MGEGPRIVEHPPLVGEFYLFKSKQQTLIEKKDNVGNDTIIKCKINNIIKIVINIKINKFNAI